MATPYYVSQVDGNDGYNGLYPTYISGTDGPWLTISKADDLSGDQSDNSVLFRKGGTWGEGWNINCYGTSDHPFTIGAYGTGAKPVIDAEDTRAYCFNIENTGNYVIIDGLESKDTVVISYRTGCINIFDRTGVQILNCNIYHPTSRGINASNNTSLTIDSCLIDTTIVTDSNQYEADGIYAQNGGGDLVITHNTILSRRDSGSMYIDSIQTYNEAGGEIAYNFLANPTGYSSVGGNMLIQLKVGTGTWEVHHNILFNDTNKKGIFPIEGSATYHIYNNTIINVASESGDSEAISNCLTVLGTYTPAEFKMKNNILYTSYALCMRWLPATDPSTANIDYNCLYRESGTNLVYLDTERTWAAWQGLGYDANGMNENPLLVDVNGGDDVDYKLTSISPCINEGVDVSLTEDYWGNPIVGLPDIGAYEYQMDMAIFFGCNF